MAATVAVLLFSALLPLAAGAETPGGQDGSSAVAALAWQAARLRRGLEEATREQLYAYDPDMCECSSGAGPARPVLLDTWVKSQCGGWGEVSRCVARVVQDVRRIAPFNRTVDLAGAGFTEAAVRALQQQAVGYLQEQRDSLTRIEAAIAALQVGPEEARGASPGEVADSVSEALRFGESPDRSVAMHVGLPAANPSAGGAPHGLLPDWSCTCFRITQPRTLWDDAADTQPLDDGGAKGMPRAPAQAEILQHFLPQDVLLTSPLRRMLGEARRQRQLKEMSEQQEVEAESKAMTDDHELFLHYVTLGARKYAREHKVLTWGFLLGFECGALAWEPICDSGPPFPEYTIPCSGCCQWAPCSNVYQENYVFPAAFSGLYYWNSCPYGIYTSKPELLASSFLNPSGRQWPERTCCGSHPSKSSASDGGANNMYLEMYEKAKKDGKAEDGKAEAEKAEDGKAEDKKETSRRLAGTAENELLYAEAGKALVVAETGERVLFAPKGHVYDARLVEALHSFAEQGASLRGVTLFTTRLHQLRALGWNPADSNLQHMGVTLELSRPVRFDGRPCRFLTLEMMADGLMWTLGEEAAPTTHYDYQKKRTMRYDDLSPRVAARYVAGQRGRTYAWGKTDCQTVALELAERLALHGRRRLQSMLGVNAHVVHPAAGPPGAAWKHVVERHVRALLRGEGGGAMRLQAQETLGHCPGPVPALETMSEGANRAWQACAEPLAITPVYLEVLGESIDELVTVLDLLSDDGGMEPGAGIWLGLPRTPDADFGHGPSYAEWKHERKPAFDPHFLLVLLFALVLFAAFCYLLCRGARGVMGAAARSPWGRAAVPVVFGVSLLSGTVGAPLAVGAFWAQRRRQEKRQGGNGGEELSKVDGEEGNSLNKAAKDAEEPLD